MIEHAYIKNSDDKLQGKPLSAVDQQICPDCGKETFRTEVTVHFEPSSSQDHPSGIPRVDYEMKPIKYTEE